MEQTVTEQAETGNAAGDIHRRIYLFHDLPPEVVAVAFAKTSRSPKRFDEIAAELSEEQSSRFHEKWVVGYGHASVAEHAVLSIAVEDVSILAAKAIEDNRLSSFTEKSTRYQIYSADRYYTPPDLTDSEAAALYRDTIRKLLTTYAESVERIIDHLAALRPRPETLGENAWRVRLRAEACDAARYVLPVATLTNLAWTVNARVLASSIRKMGAAPHVELREIAATLTDVARERVPTLLKYADPDEYRVRLDNLLSEPDSLSARPSVSVDCHGPESRLIDFDRNALDSLVIALVYPHRRLDYESVRGAVAAWDDSRKIAVLREAFSVLGPHDPLPRFCEHTGYTHEITIDYGAWRDVQRHRLCTQTAQELGPELGITVPALFDDVGLTERFTELAKEAGEAYAAVAATHPAAAVYVLPLAFRKRSLFVWNLRELFHFVRLRGGAKGHAAYRTVARQTWDTVCRAQPWICELLRPWDTADR